MVLAFFYVYDLDITTCAELLALPSLNRKMIRDLRLSTVAGRLAARAAKR
jgi:hypothetical protein